MIINFTEKTGTDSRFRFIHEDPTDQIIIGGSVSHFYEVPFKAKSTSGYASHLNVWYKQGSDIILDIDITDDMIHETNHNTSIIKVDLGPLQTQLFKDTLLDTFSQIRVKTYQNEIFFTDIQEVIVKEPLKVEPLVG